MSHAQNPTGEQCSVAERNNHAELDTVGRRALIEEKNQLRSNRRRRQWISVFNKFSTPPLFHIKHQKTLNYFFSGRIYKNFKLLIISWSNETYKACTLFFDKRFSDSSYKLKNIIILIMEDGTYPCRTIVHTGVRILAGYANATLISFQYCWEINF